jgi:hypothetical protein
LDNPTAEITKIIQLYQREGADAVDNFHDSVVRLFHDLYDISLRETLNIPKEVESLQKEKFRDIKKAIRVLQEIRHIQSLDITEEIKLLREIKDILDELNIMSILFEDQRKVLKIMESIVHSMRKIKQKAPEIAQKVKEKPKEEILEEKPESVRDGISRGIDIRAATQDLGPTGKQDPKDVSEESKAEEGMHGVVGTEDMKKDTEFDKIQPISVVWRASNDPKNSSLPLSNVHLSIDEIEKMTQRAKGVYSAVSIS